MDELQRKALLKETFDSVSEGYDNGVLRFFPASARNMAASLGLRGDERVLDVACGTGHASFAIASKLKTGRVTAVDFSPGMLAQARKKAKELNVGNVDFLERDMQVLEFGPASFDIAVCAFGIFFVEDMDAQLSHIASTIRPGGRIMISCFQESYFHPLKDLMAKRLEAFGVKMPRRPGSASRMKAGADSCSKRRGSRTSASSRRTWDTTWKTPSSGGTLSGTRGIAEW